MANSMFFQVKLASNPKTKRKNLSEITNFFDPLGYLAPVIINFNHFVQNLWKIKLGWDQTLSNCIFEKRCVLRESLFSIGTCAIDRCILSTWSCQLVKWKTLPCNNCTLLCPPWTSNKKFFWQWTKFIASGSDLDFFNSNKFTQVTKQNLSLKVIEWLVITVRAQYFGGSGKPP